MMKRRFDIVTDSASDMPKDYYVRYDVRCVPLGFNMNNVNYAGENGEKITEEEFYQKLREGSMPTTYQVTSEQAKGYIEPSLKEGRDVLVIAFSSGLSGTAGSFQVAARQLAEEYPNCKIRVVDSLCASMGEGLLLDYVIRKADEGADVEETARYAEDLKLKICHWFTVDDLVYLKRGGRVSPTAAFVGNLLGIKPVLYMDNEGHLIPVSKVRGRKTSINALADQYTARAVDKENGVVFISHGNCLSDAEALAAILKERHGVEVKVITDVGPVIGAHSGPGTLALFFIANER
jgi:DegV family protein with EDD domain